MMMAVSVGEYSAGKEQEKKAHGDAYVDVALDKSQTNSM